MNSAWEQASFNFPRLTATSIRPKCIPFSPSVSSIVERSPEVLPKIVGNIRDGVERTRRYPDILHPTEAAASGLLYHLQVFNQVCRSHVIAGRNCEVGGRRESQGVEGFPSSVGTQSSLPMCTTAISIERGRFEADLACCRSEWRWLLAES